MWRALLLTICVFPAVTVAEPADAPACRDTEAYALLDFWVGHWTVWIDDRQVGINRIEKILNGCAIMEHWVGDGGGEGKSLFFIDTAGRWQQVWVTEQATRPGGTKQKARVEDVALPAVRFRGSIPRGGGKRYLDRTTLTPLDKGHVRQLIEVSTDGGATWRATFDAVYRPAAPETG